MENVSPVRLNLGCGAKVWPGFINVDLASNFYQSTPDVVSDLRKLPFPDDYADEAHAIHVVEHFYLWDVEPMLREWKRVLKPGGLLAIEVPCLDKVLVQFQKPNPPLRKTWLALYGEIDSRDPNMVHKWCYSASQLENALKHVGFKDVVVKEPLFHQADRDMRVEGTK